ncbi:hypothetical protein ACHHYP_13368 [Achlya hypogyna]|uniref:Serine hydrolase domain-containing protein n=1 Tax=Achlya hypogyna TaxID=1202772 RepID=A0A1V9YFD5_ACHHY|nr:hypothetical protein ACHHYP_13368 [Achlya hypogyna]
MSSVRLLCLHGMYQRSCTFRAKTAHLGGRGLELAFLDGPVNLVPKVVAASSKHVVDTAGFKAWWDPAVPLTMEDRDAVLAYVGDALSHDGPFDGVLGFSQGAVVASWLCSNYATEALGWTPAMAVFLGGYVDPHDVATVFSRGLTPGVSSFHAYGVNDRVVPAVKSAQLAQLFEAGNTGSVTRHVHQLGHIVPKSPDLLAALDAFLLAADADADADALHQAVHAN